jgi:hypothetical protein
VYRQSTPSLSDPVGLPASDWNKGEVDHPTLNGDIDSLPILRRNKPIIVLLRHRFYAFWRRLGQLLDKPPCGSHAHQPLKCCLRIENKPGEPRNTAKAGTTVFGGSIVLSSIFAQSLIIQNFPCQIKTQARMTLVCTLGRCHSAVAKIQGGGRPLNGIFKGLASAGPERHQS